jgi:serine/threonine protein kinase
VISLSTTNHQSDQAELLVVVNGGRAETIVTQCRRWLLQEYCNGGSLGDAISDGVFGHNSSRLHWRRLLATLLDVAEGMAYIHSMRICHGDLNPANILLKVCPVPLHLSSVPMAMTKNALRLSWCASPRCVLMLVDSAV